MLKGLSTYKPDTVSGFNRVMLEMLHSLIGLIVREVSEKKMMSDYLLNCYVNSVIVLAVRNLSTSAPEHDNADSSKAQYMHKIYQAAYPPARTPEIEYCS